MTKQIPITVPKPCSQQYSSFPRTSNGGYCSSCKQEVIDFTTWSDDRLKAFFKNGKNSTCGKFRKEQLITYTDRSVNTPPYGWLSLFFAGGLLLFSSRQTFGQQRHDFAHHPIAQYDRKDSTITLSTSPVPLRISGVVNSPEDQLKLPGVNVVLKGTTYGTTTDGDGRFSMTVTDPVAAPVIVFSFIGFETKEYSIPAGEADLEIRIDMFLDKTALDEEIIVGGCYVLRWYNPRTWWWKIKSLF